MLRGRHFMLLAIALLISSMGGAWPPLVEKFLAARVDSGQLETNLSPAVIRYDYILPDGYAESKEAYPLLLFLHGGEGGRVFLNRMAPLIRAMWAAGELPAMVVVTPVVERGLYMDFADGSQQWESIILGPLLGHAREKFRIAKDPKQTFIAGVSMGGMGALRMAFKHPDRFGAVVAFEPGIEPAFEWDAIKLEDRFWRDDAMFQRIFGAPVNKAFWKANNPASIAQAQAGRIRAAGIQIYLEAGDEDAFGLYRGAEFLHRVLFDTGVQHEYRLVRGADHVGVTLGPRIRDGLGFLNRVMTPTPPDPAAQGLRRVIQRWRKEAGLPAE